MERTVSVGATTIPCNNPGFTLNYMIILFPINCLPDTTSVLKGQTNKCESQSEIYAFRTICGFNFIPWKSLIFFYMGSFSRKGNVTP
jgi:hypothetical protein